MRLLTGLLHPDAGSIELLGRPFGRGDRHRLFEVGALVESPAFYPYLSGRANLRELAATGAPAAKTRVEELLELVGLRDRATEPVSRFSLGMKQRLGIAMALLPDPKLLLLDEPANGLDPSGIIEIRDLLRSLHREQGKTIFVSSHLLAEVEKTCTHIGIIHKGLLRYENTLEQLRRDAEEGSQAIFTIPGAGGRLEALAPHLQARHLGGDDVLFPIADAGGVARLNEQLVATG